MTSFEVYYKDLAIPEPVFMVVIRAESGQEAQDVVASNGYQPIRVKPIGKGK